MVSQQVSFVERASLSQRVPYQRFHCIWEGCACVVGGEGEGRNQQYTMGPPNMGDDNFVTHV